MSWSLVLAILLAFSVRLITAENEDIPRAASFRWRGTVRDKRDTAHLSAHVNVNQQVEGVNAVSESILAAEKNARQYLKIRAKDSSSVPLVPHNGRNVTFGQLFEVMRVPAGRTTEKAAYVCELLECSVTVRLIERPAAADRVSDASVQFGPAPTGTSSTFAADLPSPSALLGWAKGNVTSTIPLDRRARQLGLLLGGVNLGLGIYSFSQIQQLKQDVFVLEENQNRLFSIVGQHERALRAHHQAINRIIGFLGRVEDWAEEETLARQVDEYVYLLHLYLEEEEAYFDDIITLLFERRLPPRFFHREVLDAAVGELGKKVAAAKLDLATTSINEVLMAPLSYVAETGNIYFFIHLDCVEPQILDLYSLVDAPVRLPDGRTLRLLETRRFLATDESNSLYFTLNDEEFSRCKKRGGDFVCSMGVTTKSPDSSCLPALFNHRQTVGDLCSFSLTVEKQETLTQINDNEVVVTAPTGVDSVSARLNCRQHIRNGTFHKSRSTELLVIGARVIKVDRACVLSTDHFSFRPTYTRGIHQQFVVRNISLDMLRGVIMAADPFKSLPTFHNKSAFAFKLDDSFAIKTDELEPIVHSSHQASIAADVCVVVGVIVGILGVAGAGIFLWKRHELAKRRLTNFLASSELQNPGFRLGDLQEREVEHEKEDVAVDLGHHVTFTVGGETIAAASESSGAAALP